MSSDPDKYRLPTDVKPTHYDLTIITDLLDLTFDGIVKIKYCIRLFQVICVHLIRSFVSNSLDILRETSTISLNITELKLKKAYVNTSSRPIDRLFITRRSIYSDVLKGGQAQACKSVEIDTVSERVTYTFPSVLPAGSKAELTIAYAGRLTGNMAGYYKSSWVHEGKTKHYALTQFEVSFKLP